MNEYMLHYLILAHTNPKQLAILITSLYTQESNIYIHVDKDVSINPFLFLADRCKFIKNRVSIHAGGFSMVQATLNGFKEIYENMGMDDHVILMSGQDFPIKSAAYIYGFIAKEKNKTIIQCIKQPFSRWNTVDRVTRYRFYYYTIPFGLDKYIKKKIGEIYNISSFKSSLLGGILNRTLSYILPRRTFLLDNYELYSGSQWAIFSTEAIVYILDFCDTQNGQTYINFMQYAGVPDEFFFQTLLMNSPLRKNIINDLQWYIDRTMQGEWPKILRLDDINALFRSPKLFARKFNIDKDAAILEKIAKHIQS